ncbi:MAG: hypothetical protein LBS73_03145 [Campylobacteraceae bacterium]|jgi:hypothetical protein|nr:hypothetical protein [Campylobacteraceae bacterium]
MVRYLFLIVGGMLLFSGCYVKQNVSPVDSVKTKDICIIKNIYDDHDIVGAYTRALQSKGYKVTVKQSTESNNVCPLTTSFNVHWGFSRGVYLSLLHLYVYQNGKSVGEALYDVQGGWASEISKRKKAEDTVIELVNRLYP